MGRIARKRSRSRAPGRDALRASLGVRRSDFLDRGRGGGGSKWLRFTERTRTARPYQGYSGNMAEGFGGEGKGLRRGAEGFGEWGKRSGGGQSALALGRGGSAGWQRSLAGDGRLGRLGGGLLCCGRALGLGAEALGGLPKAFWGRGKMRGRGWGGMARGGGVLGEEGGAVGGFVNILYGYVKFFPALVRISCQVDRAVRT